MPTTDTRVAARDHIAQDVPLFDLAIGEDAPRARASDPVTSHLAADKSARGLSKLRVAVLRVVSYFPHEGATGSLINAAYRNEHNRDDSKFPQAHPDSPRKRAGELADDGYLDVIGHKVGEFGSPEAVYRISPEGRRLLELRDVTA